MSQEAWPNTRASIIGRLRDSADLEAWNQVVDTYSPLLYRYCLSRGLQGADAFDISQNVLIKLRDFEYRPEKGKFRAWLGTVVRNEVNMLWRKKRNTTAITSLNVAPGRPALDWERIFHAHILDTALNRIRPEFTGKAWQAFEKLAIRVQETGDARQLVWVNDGSATDIANQLGQSREWVYKTKSRILRRLRDEILSLADELALLPE